MDRVDPGALGGRSRIHRDGERARLVVTPLTRWTEAKASEVEVEGAALLCLHAPDAVRSVEVASAP